MNSYRNCHQRTNIPNRVRTFSVLSLISASLPPHDLGILKFVRFTDITPRSTINAIAVGISQVNALMVSVLIVIILAKLVKKVRTLQDVVFVNYWITSP